MDGMRERMIFLIQDAVDGCARNWAEIIADHLIANGVIFKEQSNNVKFVPCVCGYNSRFMWHVNQVAGSGWIYECKYCGMISPKGKTKLEAKREWNKMIEELKGKEA